MTQDEHLAAAILNEIYDAKITDRISVVSGWIVKIREMNDDRKPPAGEQIGEVASTGSRDARESAPTMFLVEPDRAVCVGGKWHGWLFWLHPNGNWVSARKLPETGPTIDPLFSMSADLSDGLPHMNRNE